MMFACPAGSSLPTGLAPSVTLRTALGRAGVTTSTAGAATLSAPPPSAGTAAVAAAHYAMLAAGALATVSGVRGVALDNSTGRAVVYLYERGAGVVSAWSMQGSGLKTHVAGRPAVFGHADGVGTNALFAAASILNIALHTASGHPLLFVGDFGNARLRCVNASSRVVTTVVGSAVAGAADGVGSSAQLSSAQSYLALDPSASSPVLYMVDGPALVRRVDVATRTVTTIAGLAAQQTRVDAVGTLARFTFARQLTFGPADSPHARNLYIADASWIRVLDLRTNAVTTLAGVAVGQGLIPAGSALNAIGAYMQLGTPYLFFYVKPVVYQLSLTSGNSSILAGSAAAAGATNFDGVGTSALLNGADLPVFTLPSVDPVTGTATVLVNDETPQIRAMTIVPASFRTCRPGASIESLVGVRASTFFRMCISIARDSCFLLCRDRLLLPHGLDQQRVPSRCETRQHFSRNRTFQ